MYAVRVFHLADHEVGTCWQVKTFAAKVLKSRTDRDFVRLSVREMFRVGSLVGLFQSLRPSGFACSRSECWPPEHSRDGVSGHSGHGLEFKESAYVSLVSTYKELKRGNFSRRKNVTKTGSVIDSPPS